MEDIVEKVIRNGKVAVLYSPGYGAGWYSWNTEHKACLFDPEIVAAVEAGNKEEAGFIAERKYKGFYAGGACDLEIEWLPVGTLFDISEYDGLESIHLQYDQTWLVA